MNAWYLDHLAFEINPAKRLLRWFWLVGDELMPLSFLYTTGRHKLHFVLLIQTTKCSQNRRMSYSTVLAEAQKPCALMVMRTCTLMDDSECFKKLYLYLILSDL